MEEDWVNREVDPDEARRRQGEGEDEGVALTPPPVLHYCILKKWKEWMSLQAFL